MFPKIHLIRHSEFAKIGDRHEITKKQPIDNDPSRQIEKTIHLEKDEYTSFSKLEGKRLRKIRYDYGWDGHLAEIDVFQDDLSGLVLADVEFKSDDLKHTFQTPSFCLAEVTHENFLAGGMLCGKKYSDIEKHLKKFGYKKI